MLNRGRKIVAVIGITREQVEAGIAHARTAGDTPPVWVWCAERCDAVPGCDRFLSGVGAARVAKDLRGVWPALTIVTWTGDSQAPALKLLPLFVPPFRVVAFNEANGFFAVRPAALLKHARRRSKDAVVAGVRMAGDWLWSHVRDLANWVWNVFLAALASAAQSSPAVTELVRRFMARTMRTRWVPAPVERTQGSEFVEIVLAGRAWARQEVLRAVGESAADFVIFRARGERSGAERLVALARETNAFAVARQIAWTGWRDIVLHRHPFRVLQAGEVAAVEAPHSTLIVMRRDLLEKLGVPPALTSGAALMQIFWRAGAAGLASLTVGDGGPVTQEPAMQLEDAEFVLRQKTSGAESFRGNVAWSPFHRRGFRDKPRVLVVSPYLPFPLTHGGAVRIYNLCRALAGEVDFLLACFRERDETVRYAELHEIFREVWAIDIDEKQAEPGVPAQVTGYRNSAMARLIQERCETGAVDLLQLEYTQMAGYAAYAGQVPVILVEHDITFTLYRQLGNLEHYKVWRSFERKALRAASAVWTMSAQDRAAAVKHGAPRDHTVVVANGVDSFRFRPGRKERREQTILFVGSFRHPPNLLAFEALRDKIMPAVWEAYPSARLHVIAGPNEMRFEGLDARIGMDGFVEDVRPAYRDCDLVVVPLPVSAGTNIKVMEAMACGRALVSTALGCQGLGLEDGVELLIRDIGMDFSSAITSLLQDDELRARMGERGRATVERRFDWSAIARDAMGSYESLMQLAEKPVAHATRCNAGQ